MIGDVIVNLTSNAFKDAAEGGKVEIGIEDEGELWRIYVKDFGPGISEALVSTVAGLIVAIPALLGYNFIGSRIRELAGETSQFATGFLALIEREFTRDQS